MMDGPLRLGGTAHERGLGVHANSVLEYALKPEYLRFVAILGGDDSMLRHGGGTVVFEVRIDDALAYRSPVIRSGEYAHLDLALPDGARRIRLIVTDGGDGIDCDHADWADAGFLLRDE